MRETDLLRKAAHLHEGVAKSAEHRGEPPAVVAGLRRDAASLLALADQMERAEPVAVRQWHDEFKCWNYDDIEDVLPSCKGERLYLHPAPEVKRAEPVGWLESPHGAFKANPAFKLDAPKSISWSFPVYLAAMQEPKP